MRMEEERKSRQKYVEGLESIGSGYRRSLDHQIEERQGKKGDALEQKDRDREAEAIRVRIKQNSDEHWLTSTFIYFLDLQERYLGGERKRKRMRRLADRKFVFDWDTTEDTSTDFNPMYAVHSQVVSVCNLLSVLIEQIQESTPSTVLWARSHSWY